jgi:hypothetical protein
MVALASHALAVVARESGLNLAARFVVCGICFRSGVLAAIMYNEPA